MCVGRERWEEEGGEKEEGKEEREEGGGGVSASIKVSPLSHVSSAALVCTWSKPPVEVMCPGGLFDSITVFLILVSPWTM